MNINDLPDVILEKIFYVHYSFHRQSLLPLLSACRRWYNVVTNCSALWRLIPWNGEGRLPPMKVRCYNPKSLAKIIDRTGTATFEFHLGCSYQIPPNEEIELFTSSVDKNWLSRCSLLSLFSFGEPWRLLISNTVCDILRSSSFDALERLELIHKGTEAWELMLDILMSRVECTSPKLRYLKLEPGVKIAPLIRCVFNRFKVLRRIRTLHVISMNAPIPWNDLHNLEQLAFHNVNYSSSLLDIVAPRFTSLVLEGDYRSNNLPLKLFPQLTHLTLYMFELQDPANTIPLSLPSLVSLTLTSTYFELSVINAPELEEFVIRIDPSDESPCIYPIFKYVTLTPRILRLDILSDEGAFVEFEDPLRIWKRVEELHLTFFIQSPTIKPVLAQVLSGRSASGQCFPSLRCLTLLYPSSIKDGGPPGKEKRLKVDELRGMAHERVAAGLHPLERVEVGWYWTNNDAYVLEDPLREWWVTEWTSLL